MGIFDYLIVVGLVALILGTYRQLDKNNRSLEKVKRLGDKMLGDLDAVSQEKAVELRDMAIQVEVHQEASKKALERLGQAEEAINQKSQHLEELQEKIGAYDSALRELIDMTQKAEENIGRLREESAYIDKVGRRIRQASGQLQELQTRIPKVLSEFSEKNTASLAELKDSVLVEIEDRHTELSRRVDAADQQSAGRIFKMQQQIDELEGDLGHRVDAYREAFDDIEKDYSARLETVAEKGLELETQALQNLGRSIEEHMNERFDQLRAHVEKKAEEITFEDRALEQEILEIKAKSTSWEDEMSQNLQGIFTRLSKEVADHAESVQGELSKLDTQFQEAEQNTQNDLQALDGRIAEKIQAFGIKIQETETNLLVRLQEADANVLDKTKAVDSQIQDFENHLEAGLQGLDTRSLERAEAFGQRLEESEARLQNALQALDARSLEEAQALKLRLETSESTMESDLKALDSRALEKAENLEALFKQRLEEVKQKDGLVFDQFKEEFAAWQRDLENYHQTLELEVREQSKEHQQKFEDEISRDYEKVEALKQEMQARLEDCDAFNRDSLDDLQRVIENQKEQMEGQLYEIDKSLEQKLQDSLEKGQNLADTLLMRISNDVDAKTASMSEAINQRVDAVNASVQASHDQIDTNFTELRQRVDSWIEASQGYMNQFEQQVRELDESSKAASKEQRETLDAYIQQTRENLDAWEQQLGKRVNDLETFITRAEDLVSTEFSRLQSHAQDLAHSTGLEVEDLFKESRQAILSATETKLQEFQTELSAGSDALRLEYQNILKEVENWELETRSRQDASEQELKQRELDFRQDFEAQIEALQRLLDSKHEVLQQAFDARLKDQAEEIQTLLDDGQKQLEKAKALDKETQDRQVQLSRQFEDLDLHFQTGLTAISQKYTQEKDALASALKDQQLELETQVREALDAHQSAVQDRMSTLRTELKEGGELFQGDLKYWKEALEEKIQELTGLSEGLHKDTVQKVQNQIQDIQNRAQNLYGSIQDDLSQSLAVQEARIKTLLSSNEGDLSRIEALGEETRVKVDAWQDLLETSSKNLSQEIANIKARAVEDSIQGIQGIKEQLSKQYDDVIEGLNESFGRLKSELNHSRNDVEQDVKFLNQQVEQWKQTFQEQLKNLEAQSKNIEAEAFDGLKERLAALREEAKTLTKSVQDEFQVNFRETQSNLLGQIDAYKNELKRVQALRTDMEGKITEFQADLQSLRSSNAQQMEGASKDLANQLKDLKERMSQSLNAENARLLDESRKTWGQTQLALQAQKEEQAKDIQKALGLLEEGRADLQEKLKALQQDAGNMRRDAMTSIQERIDSLRDEARKMTGQVKTEIHSVLNEHQTQIEKQLKQSEDEFHRIQDLNSTSQLRFQEIQDVFGKAEEMAQKEFEHLREQVKQMIDDNAQGLQAEIVRQKTEVQALVQNNVQGFADSADKLRKEMQKDLQLLQGEMDHYKGDMASRFEVLDAEGKKLQEEVLEAFRRDLEKVKKQGDTLAQGMQEQTLKSLENQRQQIAGLLQASSEDLNQTKAYNQETHQELAKVQAGIQEKIAQLEAAIRNYSENAAHRIEQSSDEYQQTILSGIEKRLKDYEEEISYRMGKIETVNDDIDNLETNLRKSMDRLSLKLKEDVDKMAASFKQNHQNDVDAARKDFEGLGLQMLGLEKDLEALKKRAYDNVSENLKVFEDEFFVDIKNRSQKMDQRINDWKNEVNGLLEALSQKEQNERQMLEESYSNLIRTRLAELEATFKTRLSKASEDFDVFQASLQERLGTSEQGIQRMQAELKEEVQGLKADTLENVQHEFVRMNQDLENRIRSYERDIESRLQKNDQDIRLKQSDTASVMDALRNDVSLWQAQVLNQIRGSSENLDEELGVLKQNTEHSIAEIQDLYSKEKDALQAESQQDRAQIKREVQDLGERMQRFTLDLEHRSRDILDSFNRTQSAFMDEMTAANSNLKDEVETEVQGFKDFVLDSRNEFEGLQRKQLNKLEDELRDLDVSVKDVDKRIKSFAAQTKLFERADILKDSLEDQISKMRSEIQQIEEQRKAVLDLDSYLSKVRKLAEDANEKVGKLTAEKRRLDSLDEDYKKLISISNAVDQKIAQVTASNDTLTEIQLSLRHLEEVQKDVNAKYDRLERKSELIDATSEGVDKNFQTLQSLESQVQTVQTAMKNLPEQVNEMADRLKTLISSKKDADTALKSVNNLDKILKDVESRIQELNTSREWIARTETRLNEISQEADEKVGLLSALVKEDLAKDKGVKNVGGPSQSVRDVVIKLSQQGWRIEEIARTTKLSRGEVELILEMRGR